MEIKPKANIDDVVNIVSYALIQTSYNWSINHLQSSRFGNRVKYYVHDIEVNISMKTGEVKYKYLISENKEKPSNHCTGWVSSDDIEIVNVEALS